MLKLKVNVRHMKLNLSACDSDKALNMKHIHNHITLFTYVSPLLRHFKLWAEREFYEAAA